MLIGFEGASDSRGIAKRAAEGQKTLTCPQCLHQVTVDLHDDGTYVCPNCGHRGIVGGGESKEGHRMPDSRDVQRLLVEASHAPTLAEAERLIAEAENLRSGLVREASREREVDLANAIITDTLTPVRVHEHHTAATDWIGSEATSGDPAAIEREMVAQATVWYGKTAAFVKADEDEFAQQAYGMGRRLAGAHGEHAQAAENAFLEVAATLRDREARSGAFHEAASGVPQVGEGGYPEEEMSGLAVDPSLPQAATTSERAPAIQALEANGGSGASQDVVSVNDPGLGQADGAADAANGDTGTQYKQAHRKEAHMQANCPTCGGHGKVAVRAVPAPSILDIVAGRHTAASNLPQIDQIVDPHDAPAATPLPQEVAWPLIGDGQAQVQQTIGEAEQQIAQREQLKGASRKQVAQMAAKEAYRRVMAGQDDSGWMGDMGQGGVAPGQQDGGNPPGTNLGQPDDVYGYGGDNGNQPLRPYGQDEANDYTNNPGMNWQPGQPTQYDGQGMAGTTGAPDATQAGPTTKQSSVDPNQDPEIAKALAFVRQRRAMLEQGQA